MRPRVEFVAVVAVAGVMLIGRVNWLVMKTKAVVISALERVPDYRCDIRVAIVQPHTIVLKNNVLICLIIICIVSYSRLPEFTPCP